MRLPAGSILILALLLLTSCTGAPPPAGPRVPVALTMGRVLVDLPVGHKAGSYEWGWGCDSPFNDVAWITEGRVPGLLTQAARDGIGWGGLGLTDGAARVLTGRLVDVDLSLCRKLDGFSGRRVGDTGDGRVRIDWELTDPPGPVHRFTTEGEGETDIPSLNARYDVILRNAAADAARHLAALPEFRQLVTSGASPAIVSAGLAPLLPLAPPPPAADAVPVPVAAVAEGEETPAMAPDAAAMVRWGQVTGGIVDARGLVLLPDTGAQMPDPLPLMLGDGRVVPGVVAGRAFGFLLIRLAEGQWPALTVRRQRPGVSQWLHRPGAGAGGDDEDRPAAMVAAHTGPDRSQGTDVPSLLLDLDEALWRNPPWMLVDGEGRLAALRGARVLAGDPAPYYAPAGVMAHFRAITGLTEAP